MSADVIQFPKNKIVNTDNMPPQSIEEVEENIDSFKYLHIQEALSLVAPMLLDKLDQIGFDFETKENTDKESIFLFEAINALLHKFYGLPHPFQELAETNFLTNDDGSIMMIDHEKIAETVNAIPQL